MSKNAGNKLSPFLGTYFSSPVYHPLFSKRQQHTPARLVNFPTVRHISRRCPRRPIPSLPLPSSNARHTLLRSVTCHSPSSNSARHPSCSRRPSIIQPFLFKQLGGRGAVAVNLADTLTCLCPHRSVRVRALVSRYPEQTPSHVHGPAVP